MKSLNFKRKENAQLRYFEEKVNSKQATQFNWDRIVYLLILGLILFFILRYFFFYNFYISANGQVIFDNVEISHTEDVRIEQIYCEEGQNIVKGDTLFSYVIEDWSDDDLEEDQNDENTSNWADREIYALEKNISLNNTEIEGDKDLLNRYNSQLSRLKNEVILGTANEKDLTNLKYQISKLETSVRLIQSENVVLNKQLAELQNKSVQEAAPKPSSSSNEIEPQYNVFIAPIDGYIARIFKEPYEVALKSQVILKIYQADSVFIKGYFEQEDLRYVKEGDKVNVNFPDGQESEGIINRFYSSTVIMPEEFQKKFEPIKRTIAVDIVPAPGSNLEIWQRYYKLSVKLTKSTF